jgi:CHAT domain-containing protein
MGSALRDLAWTYYRKGDLREALRNCRYAPVAVPPGHNFHPHSAAEINFICGVVLLAMGDFPAAFKHLSDAMQTWETRKDDRSLGAGHSALAQWHRTVGDLYLAKKHIDTALVHSARNQSGFADRPWGSRDLPVGDVWREQHVRVLIEAGHTYNALNLKREAEVFYSMALERTAQRSDVVRPGQRKERLDILRALARARWRQGDIDGAASRLTEALGVAEQTGFDGLIAAIRLDLGLAELDRGEHADARKHLTAAHQHHTKVGNTIESLYVVAALARWGLATNDMALAREHAGKITAALHGLGLFVDSWQLLFVTAQVLERDGQLAEALRTLHDAADHIDRLRTRLPTEDLRAQFVEDKQAVYEAIMRLAKRLGHAGDAFSAIERAKGRAFLDLMAQRPTPKSRSDGSRAETLFQELDLRAGTLEAEIALAQSEGATDRHEQGTLERKAFELRNVVVERERTAETLASQKSRTLSLTARPLTIAEIRGHLDERTAILNYYLGTRVSFLSVLTRETVEIVELEHGVEALAFAFAKTVASPDSAEWQELAAEAYRVFVKPVESVLRDKQHLVVVPHRAGHYFPLQATRTPRGTFLAEEIAISYLPSASLLRNEPATARRSSALGVANPEVPTLPTLPGAEREVRELATIVPTRVFARQRATKTNILAEVSRHPLLHFATHGELDPRQPLRSSLRLTPTKDDDGRVTVEEVYDWELNADIVTLSGCETGLAIAASGEPVSAGDELVGFTRGFLYAGARTVVVSLWPVADDSTAEIMIAFYRNILHMPKGEALRRAQLSVLATGRTHPFFWAPFILVGTWQ